MDIKDLQKRAHENARLKGFWDYYEVIDAINNIPEFEGDEDEEVVLALQSQFLMLIVGEVSEAMEGLRKGDKDNFKEELADIVIRTADLAGGLGIDLEAEIIKKMEKNKKRPYKHGKKF